MGWGGLQLAAFGVVGFLALPDDGLGGRGFFGALALAAASAIGFRGCAGGVAAGSLFFYLHKYGASAYQISVDSYCFLIAWRGAAFEGCGFGQGALDGVAHYGVQGLVAHTNRCQHDAPDGRDFGAAARNLDGDGVAGR